MSIVSCDSIVYLGSWLRSASAEKKRFSKVIRISYEIRKWEMRLLATGVSSANRTDVVYKGVMSSYCLKIISVIESAKKNQQESRDSPVWGEGSKFGQVQRRVGRKNIFVLHFSHVVWCICSVFCFCSDRFGTMSFGLQRNNFVLVAETTCGQANSPAAACAQGESSAPILMP